MQLLMGTSYFESHVGGLENVAARLGRELQRGGVQITWLASDATPAPVHSDACLRAVPLRASNILERNFGVPFPIPAPSAVKAILQEVKRADAVFLHDSLYLTNVAALIAARWHRKPVVITQHIGVVPYRNRALRAVMRMANRCIARPMLASADQVVFISETTSRYFSDAHFRRPPKLIFNGVDTRVFYPIENLLDKREVRKGFGIAPEQPVALFVGRFVEKKGLTILEHLARSRRDITFAFAGWGPLDPRQWNFPNVRVFDQLRGASLTPLYQASDVFVLPSTGEGLPLVLQEALACGLPVICGAETRDADPEAASLLDGVPIDGGDPERSAMAFSLAIERALEEEDARGRAAERRAFVSRRYDWAHAASRYLAIIEGLIKARGHPVAQSAAIAP